ncbi:hypothetical protein EDB85DRAFT_2276415 [Lactarius pseudohatsudake]|nr:hypothetical protein EDB85DRAFT_2276415 [Lactarius pseudohatsudake]
MDMPSYSRYKNRGESCVGVIGDSQERVQILQVGGLRFVPVFKPRFIVRRQAKRCSYHHRSCMVNFAQDMLNPSVNGH